MEQRHHYGGQAIIEGVMIRGRKGAAVAVRSASGEICIRELNIPGWAAGPLRNVPFLRGVVILLETLIIGMRALSLSAALSIQEQRKEGDSDPSSGAVRDSDQQEEVGPLGLGLLMIVALGLGIGLFFLLPLFISKGLESSGLSGGLANVVEGLLRLGIFIGYVWLIGRLADVQRVLAYHGAEHMVVAAHESGEPLTIAAARKYPTAHPRCGTAFLLTVMLLSIIVFMFVPRDPLPLVIASRIVLIPVIAALAYEFIRFAGRHPGNLFIRALISPSLLLQALTTRQPDDDQIEVALEALTHAVRLDGGTIPVEEYRDPLDEPSTER